MSEFRFPGPEDRESQSTTGSAPKNGVFSRLSGAAKGILGAVGTVLGLVLIALVWGANISSCFVPRSDSRADAMPRVPNLSERAERRMVGRLAERWRRTGGSIDDLNVWILDDRSVNAASMGQGNFVLWLGLDALTDEQLDAVYAHEFAHDRLQHSQRVSDVADVTNFLGEALGTVTGSGTQGTEALRRWSGKFVIPSYARQQELEADARSVSSLSDLGYEQPVVTVCSALAYLRSLSGDSGGGLFASHPALSDRLAALRQKYPSERVRRECQ